MSRPYIGHCSKCGKLVSIDTATALCAKCSPTVKITDQSKKDPNSAGKTKKEGS